ncbi:MAG: 23S rRNA (pseudouridine(1915)-N(3))-methyltransferase RlmH [Planctomycetota bacterium]|jgi:23S rRNA (pseudouridine1915-N3)-methyltransferase|nr:23S rRNA (pseudouridine(1915)-N(3))-methyltransferase RlmH [Planctomycetota bacterium]
MRLIVVQNGKLKDTHCIALRDEYCKRFGRFGKLEIIERKAKPGQSLWPRCDWRVLLDERGERFTSPALADKLAQWSMTKGTIAFALGEAHGHDDATRAEADVLWSLSDLVLPHQIAHVVVVEQLYRAATIQAGVDYHH